MQFEKSLHSESLWRIHYTELNFVAQVSKVGIYKMVFLCRKFLNLIFAELFKQVFSFLFYIDFTTKCYNNFKSRGLFASPPKHYFFNLQLQGRGSSKSSGWMQSQSSKMSSKSAVSDSSIKTGDDHSSIVSKQAYISNAFYKVMLTFQQHYS